VPPARSKSTKELSWHGTRNRTNIPVRPRRRASGRRPHAPLCIQWPIYHPHLPEIDLHTTETGRIDRVTGDSPHIVGAELNAAVELAQQHAMGEGKHGALVTRQGPASFTVAVSGDVPYGITQDGERS